MVAEGAPAEFGRSNGGFVNVVTKSGTNDVHGTAHGYFKNDGLSSAPKSADGTTADKYDFNQQQAGFTLGGPIEKDKAFYFVALDYQNGSSTKQTDPARIEQRVVDYFASLGSPNENGPIDRTNDARVFLGKIDWQVSPKQPARPCATTTPGPSRRTAPSTSTPGARARTPSRRTTRTRAPAR